MYGALEQVLNSFLLSIRENERDIDVIPFAASLMPGMP